MKRGGAQHANNHVSYLITAFTAIQGSRRTPIIRT